MTLPLPPTVLDAVALAELCDTARRAPRLRTHRNLHTGLDDPVNRLAIAIQPGSYVRPHAHDDRFELLLAVRGRVEVVTFDEAGVLQQRIMLAEGCASVAELPPGTFHSVLARSADSVFFEVKRGPYTAPGARFADWAPAEGEAGVPAMLAWLEQAAPGSLLRGS